MKRIFSILLVMMLLFTGCGSTTSYNTNQNEEVKINDKDAASASDNSQEEVSSEPVSLKVISPYGTPTLSMVKMFVENPEIKENVTVEYEAIESTDVLSAALINHEADMAVVPINLAAVLYNKGTGYKVAASSVWGGSYIVSSEEITSLEDLKGKSISLFGRGLTPDATLRYILTENGINPDEDVTLEYFSGSSELAANYISGQSNLGMIPQPVLTNVLMKREDSKVVIDLQEEWKKVTGFKSYPQAVLIVSDELIESCPEIVDAFLTEYKNSAAWLNKNPAEAGNYYESLDLGLKATIIEKAILECNIEYVSSSEAKESLDAYLNILYESNPKILGGKLVDEGLYFEE